MHKKSFSIIGGDKRNIALAEILFGQGHDVKMFGFAESGRELPMQCKNLAEALRESQYIIGPTPCSHNGGALNTPFHLGALVVEDLFQRIQPHQVFIAGHVNAETHEMAKHYHVRLVDMLKHEALLTLNAIPTAEGAIKIAIEETDITLHGNHAMVIGFGRIGTILCRMLRGIGAKVSAVVNSPRGFALAKSAGHDAINFAEINDYLPHVDVIYNTVPHIILDKNNMGLIKKQTLIIDLASPPYGVDAMAGRDLGLKILFSTSLPGKVAPVTTATYMLQTIHQIIEEL